MRSKFFVISHICWVLNNSFSSVKFGVKHGEREFHNIYIKPVKCSNTPHCSNLFSLLTTVGAASEHKTPRRVLLMRWKRRKKWLRKWVQDLCEMRAAAAWGNLLLVCFRSGLISRFSRQSKMWINLQFHCCTEKEETHFADFIRCLD